MYLNTVCEFLLVLQKHTVQNTATQSNHSFQYAAKMRGMRWVKFPNCTKTTINWSFSNIFGTKTQTLYCSYIRLHKFNWTTDGYETTECICGTTTAQFLHNFNVNGSGHQTCEKYCLSFLLSRATSRSTKEKRVDMVAIYLQVNLPSFGCRIYHESSCKSHNDGKRRQWDVCCQLSNNQRPSNFLPWYVGLDDVLLHDNVWSITLKNDVSLEQLLDGNFDLK